MPSTAHRHRIRRRHLGDRREVDGVEQHKVTAVSACARPPSRAPDRPHRRRLQARRPQARRARPRLRDDLGRHPDHQLLRRHEGGRRQVGGAGIGGHTSRSTASPPPRSAASLERAPPRAARHSTTATTRRRRRHQGDDQRRRERDRRRRRRRDQRQAAARLRHRAQGPRARIGSCCSARKTGEARTSPSTRPARLPAS